MVAMSHDVFKEVFVITAIPTPLWLPNQESIQIFPPGSQDAPNQCSNNPETNIVTTKTYEIAG